MMNYTDYPYSIKRAYYGPLDYDTIFDTYTDALDYATNDGDDARMSYEGQVVYVKDQGKLYIVSKSDTEKEYKYKKRNHYTLSEVAVGDLGIDDINTKLDTISGDGEGSIKKAVVDGIASVVANAPEDFDTLKEVADYIAADKTKAANIESKLSEHDTKITEDRVRIELKANADSVYTKTEADEKFITLHQDLSEYAKKDEAMKFTAGDNIEINENVISANYSVDTFGPYNVGDKTDIGIIIEDTGDSYVVQGDYIEYKSSALNLLNDDSKYLWYLLDAESIKQNVEKYISLTNQKDFLQYKEQTWYADEDSDDNDECYHYYKYIVTSQNNTFVQNDGTINIINNPTINDSDDWDYYDYKYFLIPYATIPKKKVTSIKDAVDLKLDLLIAGDNVSIKKNVISANISNCATKITIPGINGYVGDVLLYGDGKIFPVRTSYLNRYSNKDYTAIGVIAYIKNNIAGVVALKYGSLDNPDDGTLSEDGSSCSWGTKGYDIPGIKNGEHPDNGRKNTLLMLDCIKHDGWKTTTKLIDTHISGYESKAVGDLAEAAVDYPAAAASWRYKTAGTEHGDWYIPSRNEIFWSCGNMSDIEYAMKAINNWSSKSAAKAYADYYQWTSDEIDEDKCVIVLFRLNYNITNRNKNYSANMRFFTNFIHKDKILDLSDVKSELESKISSVDHSIYVTSELLAESLKNIASFDVFIANSFPLEPKVNTIYLIKKTSGSNQNTYDEYLYINGSWEHIGDTAIDMTDYAKTSSLSKVATSGSYTDLTDKPTIPTAVTKTSQLTNDSGYITLNDLTASTEPPKSGQLLYYKNDKFEYHELSEYPTLGDAGYVGYVQSVAEDGTCKIFYKALDPVMDENTTEEYEAMMETTIGSFPGKEYGPWPNMYSGSKWVIASKADLEWIKTSTVDYPGKPLRNSSKIQLVVTSTNKTLIDPHGVEVDEASSSGVGKEFNGAMLSYTTYRNSVVDSVISANESHFKGWADRVHIAYLPMTTIKFTSEKGIIAQLVERIEALESK